MSGTMFNSRNFALLFLAILLVLAFPSEAEAYIGPGAGIAVVGSFLVMFTAVCSALLALFTWPIRWIIRGLRYRRAFAKSRVKRFVILGLDGMDPELADRFMAEGKLPNFAKLAEQGCFKRLRTTLPAVSPVAWSSFQTGVNPGKHNIFDFLTRDKRTYQPKLSSVDIRGPRRQLSLGRRRIPLSKSDIRPLRKGRQFWKELGEHGIFSNVLRVPITYPPEKFRGLLLSGMCVPDLRGSQGFFSFYTTRTARSGAHTGGEYIQLARNGNTIKTELIGCANPFSKDDSTMKCPFTIEIVDESSALIAINGQKLKLRKDVYSDWIKVEFKAGLGVKVSGICRFLLLSATPDVDLYVTPINIDPEKPVMPITHPTVYSTYLAKQQGPFATLGLAEDSWALNEGILNDDSFIEQCVQCDREREMMFFDALDKVKRGLCVCVFDGTDRIQHVFWRYIDPGHPLYQDKSAGQRRRAIEELYERMDVLVGKTVEKCRDKDTVLMVISDHGFNTFRYGVDLNRWLEENGYLKVKQGLRDRKHLEAIDWSQTRAFAVGLTGIFLNVKGREAQGVVAPGPQADELRSEIAEKLLTLFDPDREERAVKQVYNPLETYRGPYKDESPDLIVGYQRGYRASWETAIGAVTEKVFHENKKAWSGDHCIDPSVVPGVLFCNRKITAAEPRIMDIAPTVLEMFGVSVPGYMDGKPFVIEDAQ